jgi:hypothetical protein
MNIIGLDVGRNNVTACLLTEYPDQPVRHFQNIRKEIIKCQADSIGVERLLSLKPDAVVMEPTGIWYSSFWRQLADFHKIPIYWIGHGDLANQRGAYGFKNKRDDEDAFCLALTYFDDRFVDVHGKKRYLDFATGKVTLIRDWFFECEQLDKLLNSMINQIRQRLTLEFPEVAQKKSNISQKLGYAPMWGYVAGIHKHTLLAKLHQNSVAKQLGIEISEYTKQHAKTICELQKQLDQKERDLALLMQSEEFEPYMKVLKRFGFGLRNQALLLCQCYPFDRFLLDGKPWVDYEEGNSKDGVPKSQKRHRSLRSFQLFLGLGYTEKQSGDKRVKALGGSEVTRASLYAWCLTSVLPDRRSSSWLGKKLAEANGDGWALKALKESKISGKQKIIRILFKVTRMLFYELYKETK